MTDSGTTLSYSLGASDISKIVDAILPKLSPLLPGVTDDAKYVALHKVVLALSKDKTFSNKDELDTVVKRIVAIIVKNILTKYTNEPINNPNYRTLNKCCTYKTASNGGGFFIIYSSYKCSTTGYCILNEVCKTAPDGSCFF